MQYVRHPARLRALSVTLTALALGIMLVAALLRLGPGRGVPAPAPDPASSAALEAAYGVRIERLVVTADGGLVDLRYTVLDPDKAQLMMNSVDTLPVVIGADGTELRLSKAMGHRGELVAGRSAFILYANAGSAVRAGEPVWVQIGNQRLGPLTAR